MIVDNDYIFIVGWTSTLNLFDYDDTKDLIKWLLGQSVDRFKLQQDF